MPAPLSIIIPTLNAGAELPGCFATLTEGLQNDLIAEVIVVDAGSQDATRQIAEEWGANVVQVERPSRGGQLRAGAAIAKADHLLFLHADTQLTSGWAYLVQSQLGEGPACFKLKFRSRHFMAWVTAAWANFRSRAFGLPYGDQGLLIARFDYDRVGGYPDQPLMEDVALARVLPRISLLPGYACTGASRYARDGWVRRGASNLALLSRYLLGAKPDDLVKRY